jgi:ABC-type transport system substrate-binding protein
MRAGRSPGKLAAFVVSLLALPLLTIAPAPAQKRGGTLKLYHNDTPPSASRAPNAICEIVPSGAQVNLMVNRVNPPFDNPDIRKAMSLALDRKPFNTILMEGQGRPGMTGTGLTTATAIATGRGGRPARP